MAADDDLQIPIGVLRDRGRLSPMEALAYWLCADPDGPDLTSQEAAAALGLADGVNVRVHLHRARNKLEKE